MNDRRIILRNLLLITAALLGAGGAIACVLNSMLVACGLLAAAWAAATIAALWPRSKHAASTAAPMSDDAPAPMLSVLFCDVHGLVSGSQARGASEVIAELNLLLGELSSSMTDAGGTDGLVAIWGASTPMSDHADRACRAALDMLQRLDAINERRADEDQQLLSIGVVVHSAASIGDAVAEAVRLETSTQPRDATLLVSDDARNLLGAETRELVAHVGAEEAVR